MEERPTAHDDSITRLMLLIAEIFITSNIHTGKRVIVHKSRRSTLFLWESYS